MTGRRVRIIGHPKRHGDLEDLVGRVGEVAEVRERPEGRGKVLRITGLPLGDVWLAEGHCEDAPDGAVPLEEPENRAKKKRERIRRELLGMPAEDEGEDG